MWSDQNMRLGSRSRNTRSQMPNTKITYAAVKEYLNRLLNSYNHKSLPLISGDRHNGWTARFSIPTLEESVSTSTSKRLWNHSVPYLKNTGAHENKFDGRQKLTSHLHPVLILRKRVALSPRYHAHWGVVAQEDGYIYLYLLYLSRLMYLYTKLKTRFKIHVTAKSALWKGYREIYTEFYLKAWMKETTAWDI